MLKMESSVINKSHQSINQGSNQVDYIIKSLNKNNFRQMDQQQIFIQQQHQHNYKINKNPLVSKQFLIDEDEEDVLNNNNNHNHKSINNNKNNFKSNVNNIVNNDNDNNFDSSDNEDADKMLLNIQQSPVLTNNHINNQIPPYVNNHKRKSINMESLSLTSPLQNSFKPTSNNNNNNNNNNNCNINNNENEINQQSFLNSPLPQLNRISNNLISYVNSINNKKNGEEQLNNNSNNSNNNNNQNNIKNNNNPYDQNNSSPLSHDDLSDDEDGNEFENNNNHLSTLSLNSPQLSVSQNGHHNNNHNNQNVPNNCSYPKCCICLYGPPPSFYTSAPTWADICYIALYCLTISKPELKYYHIKKDICSFIDCHYETICMRKRTSIWRQTVNMTLSHPQYFEMFQQESALENGRKGYYGLKQIHDPYEHTALNKRSRRKRRHEQKMIQEELKKNGFTNLLLNSPSNGSMTPQFYGNNQQPHGFYLSQQSPSIHHNQYQQQLQIQQHHHHHQQLVPPTPNHTHHLHSQSPSPMATPLLQFQQASNTPQMTPNHQLSSPYLNKNNLNIYSPATNHINNNSNNNLPQQFNDEIDHHNNLYNQKKLKQSNSAPLILPNVNQTQTPQFTRAKSFDDILNSSNYKNNDFSNVNNKNQDEEFKRNQRINLRKSFNVLDNENDEEQQFNKVSNRKNTLQRLEFDEDEEDREVPSSSRLTSNRLILSQSRNNVSPLLNNNNNLKLSSNNIFNNNSNNNSRSNSPLSSPHQDEFSSENESSSSNFRLKKSNNSSLSSSTINTMSLMNINSSNNSININSSVDNEEIYSDYYENEDDEEDYGNERCSPKKRIRTSTKSNELSLLEDFYQKHFNSASKEELENLANHLMWKPIRVERWLENHHKKLRNVRVSQERVISFSANSNNTCSSSTPSSNNNSPINQSPLVPSSDLNNNYKSSVNSLLN